jgi:hypothetical protein
MRRGGASSSTGHGVIALLGPRRDGGKLMQLGGPLSGLHVIKQD